jgi:hypothetical protein
MEILPPCARQVAEDEDSAGINFGSHGRLMFCRPTPFKSRKTEISPMFGVAMQHGLL